MTERGCYGRCDAFDALHRVIYILLHVLKYLNFEGTYCCVAYFAGVNK